MKAGTKIEWTDVTWNPVTGCDKVSAGCKNCYAERMAKRLKGMGQERYRNGFSVTLHPDLLDAPKVWKKPRKIFVNSMSDLFHEEVPLEFIQKVFAVARECPQHVFQILTKRSKRLRELAPQLDWAPNIWMGVSVENNAVLDRVDDLRAVPAYVRFLSCEPLLGPLPDLKLKGIHWVIVGGESGPQARPMAVAWVRGIANQCISQWNIPFFFKQWGEWLPISQISDNLSALAAERKLVCAEIDGELVLRVGKIKAGRKLDRWEWNEFPKVAGV